jgi:hypothetical protein
MKGMVMSSIMKNSSAVCTALLCCLALSCTSKLPEGPGPAIRIDDPRAPHATILYDSVVFVDKSLSRPLGQKEIFGWTLGPGQVTKIAVEAQGARRTEGNTIVAVFATFRNRTDYPLQLEGRVQFFDGDKFPIEGPTAWQRIFLPANGVASYKETPTRIDAVHYYTEIREGR